MDYAYAACVYCFMEEKTSFLAITGAEISFLV